MAQKDPGPNVDTHSLRFRLKVAAVLLGIYATMHLTAGGIIRVLTPLDLTAAAASEDPTASAATEVSSCPDDSTETSAGGSFRGAWAAANISTD